MQQAPKSHPHSERPLCWQAQEYAPRHHWWWFVIISSASLYFTLLFIVGREWSTAALTLSMTAALLVASADRPRQWRYRLDGQTLTVAGATRRRSVSFTWNLNDFALLTRERIQDRKGGPPFELIVLVGRGRLAWPRDVYLTGESTNDAEILRRMTELVAFEATPMFQSSARTLQRIARFIRIA